MLRLFHDDMQAWVNVGDKLFHPISIANSVKRGGGIPAPKLFSLYFSVIFYRTAQDYHDGICIKYRTTGKLFNIRRFDAPTK